LQRKTIIMEDTLEYQTQRIKALEDLVTMLSIEKEQLQETIRELCSDEELPDGYKNVILKTIINKQ